MTLEELMKPRYKVIADYPISPFAIGEIITQDNPEHNSWIGNNYYKDRHPEKYPHLFQKLEWWKERKIDDLPQYIKYKSQTSGKFVVLKPEKYEIKDHYGNRNATVYIDRGIEQMLWQGYFPATEEEFNSQTQSRHDNRAI